MADLIHITKCRTCRADIKWLRTAAGKSMPVNADTVKEGATEFDRAAGHISHFSTCAQADEHRRPRRAD